MCQPRVNALGSNIVLTDDNQNVLVRYEYDVFGAIRNETATSDNTRKFTGKEFDADSNLYYYGARYYDPYIGRFTQRDPVGDGGNWYAYTANNPLAFVDPTGLRGVNAEERLALEHTFGQDTADFLAATIDIEIVEDYDKRGRVPKYDKHGNINLTEIKLRKGYSASNLEWLGIFIHEATHIWQKNTDRHRGGTGGVNYDYNANQLASLNLEREEHAQAVEDWFIATYYNLRPDLDRSGVYPWWNTLERRIGFTYSQTLQMTDSQKVWLVNVYYEKVIFEIRDASLLPTRLFRAFPNP